MVITRYLFSPVHFSILIMDNENMFCWSLSTFGPLFFSYGIVSLFSLCLIIHNELSLSLFLDDI